MKLLFDTNVILFLSSNMINYKLNNADVKEVASWSDEKERYILKDEPGKLFNDFIVKYLNSTIYPLRKSLDNITFIFDKGRSWRKLYLEEYFKDSIQKQFEYKAGRKTEHNTKMFLYFNYFADTIKYKLQDIPGVSILEGNNIEADDFFKYIIDQPENTKNIIWSIDTDLQQLLHYKNENNWNIMLTPKGQTKNKKIYAPKEFIDTFIEYTPDIFNFSLNSEGSLKDIMKNLITNKDYKQYDINPLKSLIEKILSGDKSDNIPNIFNEIQEDLSKVDFVRITNKLVKLHDDIIQDFDTNIDLIVESIINSINELYTIDLTANYNLIKSNLKLNEKLIRLHLGNMPDYISDKIINKYKTNYNNTNFEYSKFSDFVKLNKI